MPEAVKEKFDTLIDGYSFGDGPWDATKRRTKRSMRNKIILDKYEEYQKDEELRSHGFGMRMVLLIIALPLIA